MQLVIGNKNYSSWSMRPWVLMKQLGIPFEEVKLRLDLEEGSAFRQGVAMHSPARTVPVLVDEGFAVWTRWPSPNTWLKNTLRCGPRSGNTAPARAA